MPKDKITISHQLKTVATMKRTTKKTMKKQEKLREEIRNDQERK